MSNETYTDLEQEYINSKHEALRMEVIEMLVQKYPDDRELGAAVREFVNLKQKHI